MPYCQNCGAFVTDIYARVFAPPARHGVRVCPQCKDDARVGTVVREAPTFSRTND